ncbi:MAG: DUF4293 domain-containing protein, partial [Bacteroidales bacterium]|nr:DUF4293 domain-containing protein [Bacteroidales bacterium]
MITIFAEYKIHDQMIQRIQTLFLALAVIAIVLMFFYPLSSITEFTKIQDEI